MPSTANAVTRGSWSGWKYTYKQIRIGTTHATSSAFVGTACLRDMCASHELIGSIRSRPEA